MIDSDVVLAEDTRSYQKLLTGILKIFNLSPKQGQKLISYYKEVEFEKLPEVLQYLVSGLNVSLVSDAGTPLISDPGYLLLSKALERNIPYDSVPGPSSVTNALVLSGFQSKKWMFLGFFPKKRNDLTKLLNSLSEISAIDKDIVFIAFESSQRINESLRTLSEVKREVKVAVIREMTKKFQEVVRGKPEELLKREFRGEIVLVFRLEGGKS